VVLLIFGCGEEGVGPPPTGNVSGEITFVGNQPNSGLVYINAAVHYPIEESFDSLFILRHKPRSKREEERIKRISSLLGRDFLNRYSLLLNRKKDIVVIRDEDG